MKEDGKVTRVRKEMEKADPLSLKEKNCYVNVHGGTVLRQEIK